MLYYLCLLSDFLCTTQVTNVLSKPSLSLTVLIVVCPMQRMALDRCTLFQKKRHPFYFYENLTKYYPISVIFGSSIAEEICNKSMHVYPPHLFTVLISYLVKLWSIPVLHVLKTGPFTTCNKLARCHPNFIILADTCQGPEEFCNETFT